MPETLRIIRSQTEISLRVSEIERIFGTNVRDTILPNFAFGRGRVLEDALIGAPDVLEELQSETEHMNAILAELGTRKEGRHHMEILDELSGSIESLEWLSGLREDLSPLE